MAHEQLAGAADRLCHRFEAVRSRTLRLANRLSAEDQQIQAFDYASPTKWHLAHTTWFFDTFILARFAPEQMHGDPSYALLYNSYYEGAGERFARAHRGLLSRPSLAEIHAYRQRVDEAMVTLLHRLDVDSNALHVLVELGLQHEEQHQELLLTDVLANFSVNPTHPAWSSEPVNRASVEVRPAWVEFASQLADVGHDDDDTFCFDNERPRHRVCIEPFALRTTPVTNAEVQAFIADAGYRRPELWLSDGIDWVRAHGIEAPGYWRRDGDGNWRSLTLYGDQPVDPHAPAVHINAYEADAIATWMGARLPTEHEWELAARAYGDSPDSIGRWLEDGPILPQMQPRHGQPFTALWGEVWEWTRSAYQPYPGFRPLPGTVGEYNGKFMANQWVLRGGSCATAPGHVRASYRNFFYLDQRWQFAGMRLARDLH